MLAYYASDDFRYLPLMGRRVKTYTIYKLTEGNPGNVTDDSWSFTSWAVDHPFLPNK